MRRRYFGSTISDIPDEEIGNVVGASRLVALSAALLPADSEKQVLIVLKSIKTFLNSPSNRIDSNARRLSIRLIIGLLVDCLKFETPLSDKEKRDRRKFFESLPVPIKVTTGVPARAHFRSELIWTLMFEPGTNGAMASKSKRYVSKMEASELAAFWLHSLGANIGGDDAETSEMIESKARCELEFGLQNGKIIAQAANTLRHHYTTWNVAQEPGMAKGVYSGNFLFHEGKRNPDYTTDLEATELNRW